MACSWQKLQEERLEEVVNFAQKHYPNLGRTPKDLVQGIFVKYKDTAFIYVSNRGEVRGFGVFQEWPDCLNFIMVCLPFGTKVDNYKALLKGRKVLPKKKIVWYDEEKMEARGLC